MTHTAKQKDIVCVPSPSESIWETINDNILSMS